MLSHPLFGHSIELSVLSRSTPRRAPENPIVTPAMVIPSRPDLEVVGAFNPAAIRHGEETILLLRVAEAPPAVAGQAAAPIYNADSRSIEIKTWPLSDDVNVSDPRVIIVGGGGEGSARAPRGRIWLTSISHLRIARSSDGIHFEVDPLPAMSADNEYETFGIEDARITVIDGTYWINYSAVSPHGVSTALASTKDFRTFERHGIIFPPANKDVTIFPEKIGGRYFALHRPQLDGFERPAMWIASSPDLLSWGGHSFLAGARDESWDNAKVGGGAVPFRVRTENYDGWLAIYHGVTDSPVTYSLGALLLDAEDPSRVIARSRDPFLWPEAPYEQNGFFDGVVFTCGLVVEGDVVRIYYGAADGVTAVADLSLNAILAGLSPA